MNQAEFAEGVGKGKHRREFISHRSEQANSKVPISYYRITPSTPSVVPQIFSYLIAEQFFSAPNLQIQLT